MKKKIWVLGIIGLILVFLFWIFVSPRLKANRILKNLYENYGIIIEIVYTGFVDMDFESEPLFEYDIEYYEILHECNTMEKLKNLLNSVYTREYAQEIFEWCTVGERPIIIERNGKLYRIDAYARGTPFNLPVTSAKRTAKNEIVAKIKRTDGKFEFVDIFTLKNENGMWKIADIETVDK